MRVLLSLCLCVSIASTFASTEHAWSQSIATPKTFCAYKSAALKIIAGTTNLLTQVADNNVDINVKGGTVYEQLTALSVQYSYLGRYGQPPADDPLRHALNAAWLDITNAYYYDFYHQGPSRAADLASGWKAVGKALTIARAIPCG